MLYNNNLTPLEKKVHAFPELFFLLFIILNIVAFFLIYSSSFSNLHPILQIGLMAVSMLLLIFSIMIQRIILSIKKEIKMSAFQTGNNTGFKNLFIIFSIFISLFALGQSCLLLMHQCTIIFK